jgi:polyisoprenoid-binding protein YceI
MKKIYFKYLLLSALIVTGLHSVTIAQQSFKLDTSSSKLRITGTSSVHNWEMEAKSFTCETSIVMDGSSIVNIAGIDFTCLVEEIKSNNKIMDNKTHKALNSSKYPEIRFQLNKGNPVIISEQQSTLKGNLTIAGKKKEMDMVFTIVAENKDNIKVKGTVPLKMSDFEIDPPTAMMGTLKTGDEILISYEFTLRKNQEIN